MNNMAFILIQQERYDEALPALLERSLERNWKLVNGVGNCTFINCHANFTDHTSIELSAQDTNYPSDGSVTFTKPTQNIWIGGVAERPYQEDERVYGLRIIEGRADLDDPQAA